jgi:hypothetical protein
MKVRLTHNSIRVRVRKSELAELEAEHQLTETIGFPNQAFSIRLHLVDTLDWKATVSQEGIDLGIPHTQGNHWMTTEQVGISVDIPLEDEGQIHILVEKDFPCAHQPNADNRDTFKELADKQ